MGGPPPVASRATKPSSPGAPPATGKTNREDSTRVAIYASASGSAVGPVRGILVELRKADKNASCGPILRKPSGCPLDLDNLAEGVVKPALLRCSVCKQRLRRRSRLPRDKDTAHVALLVFSPAWREDCGCRPIRFTGSEGPPTPFQLPYN